MNKGRKEPNELKPFKNCFKGIFFSETICTILISISGLYLKYLLANIQYTRRLFVTRTAVLQGLMVCDLYCALIVMLFKKKYLF